MSVKHMRAVLDSGLPPSDTLVAVVLADYASPEDGDGIRPSVGTVVRRSRLSERAVRGALARLRRARILEQQGVHGIGRGASVPVYRLRVENLPPATAAPLPPARTAPPPPAADAGRPGAGDAPGAAVAADPLQHLQKPPAADAPNTSTEPNTEPKSKASPLFDEFWTVYPEKKGKGDARKAFARALHRATAEQIIAGAARYRDDPNREDSFTKWPQGWLNADRWEDGPLPPRGGGAPARESNADRIKRLRREDDER